MTAFRSNVEREIKQWRNRMENWSGQKKRIAIWAASSKAVAFTSILQQQTCVTDLVDINQRKHGAYLPGTRLQVVPPEALINHPPDKVIVMNSIYEKEIQQTLTSLDIQAETIVI